MSTGFQQQKKQRFNKIKKIVEEKDPDRSELISKVEIKTGLTRKKVKQNIQTLVDAGEIPEKYGKNRHVPEE